MEYLCQSCSVGLTPFEIKLNKLYPIGKLYCEFCQSKHEREIIKKVAEDEADMTDDYVRKIAKLGDTNENS
jgi:hypothetical protein|tara:strand:+ start:281 stop:493 length:213 start_codon:yes stop_codon:yes gene_type:complete